MISTAMHTGYVDIYIFDKRPLDMNDAYKSIESGNFVSHSRFKNRLTDYAIKAMTGILVGAFYKIPRKIKLGTGTPPPPYTGPQTFDTDCWVPVPATYKTCDMIASFLDTSSEYGVTYDTTEANGIDFTEAALFDEDGKCWAHALIDLRKELATPQTAIVLWKIQHTGN